MLTDRGGDTRYEIVELPLLTGTVASGEAISEQGWVAGLAITSAGNVHATLWHNETAQDLGTLGWPMALAQRFYRTVSSEKFQVWTLIVHEDHTGLLICDDGNGTVLLRKDISFMDLPLRQTRLYFTNNTIYLPSETKKGSLR